MFAAKTGADGHVNTPGEVIQVNLATMQASAAWVPSGDAPVALLAGNTSLWVAVLVPPRAGVIEPSAMVLDNYTYDRNPTGYLLDYDVSTVALDPDDLVWYNATAYDAVERLVVGPVVRPGLSFFSGSITVSLRGQSQVSPARMAACADGLYVASSDAESPLVNRISYLPVAGQPTQQPSPYLNFAKHPENLVAVWNVLGTNAPLWLWCAPGGGAYVVTFDGAAPAVRTVLGTGGHSGPSMQLPVDSQVFGSDGGSGLWIGQPRADGSVSITSIDPNLHSSAPITVPAVAGSATHGDQLWTVSTDPNGTADWIITTVAPR
jgi:hypothetical protein